jgi:two-component system response regulator YesN
VADDEVVERRFLRLSLDLPEQGFRVKSVVSNGQELLDAYLRYRPDIVLSDIYMPEMNGLEACRLIRQLDPDVILILNTAYAEFGYAQTALHAGIDAFLLKPSDKDKLLETINELIAKRQAEGRSKDTLSPAGTALFTQLNQLYTALASTDHRAIYHECEATLDILEHNHWEEDSRLILLNVLITLHGLMRQNPLLNSLPQNPSDKEIARYGQSLDVHALRLMLRGSLQQITRHLQDNYLRGKNPAQSLDLYLQQNFRQDIKLEDLEEEFYLSGAYLSELYKEAYGYSLFDRLRDLRLAEACRLLEQSSLSVEEVAHACGYPNTTYFHRLFKQKYQLTPGSYRKQARDKG